MKFTVIQDTREKLPWEFSMYEECKGTFRYGLREGDYTTGPLLRLEKATGRKILRVERKMTTSEIGLNLTKEKQRFLSELDRLVEYEYKYLILEFSINDLMVFPEKTRMPPKLRQKCRYKGPFLYKQLMMIEEEYQIPVIFAGNESNAKNEFIKIVNEIHDANKEEILRQCRD